MASFLKGMTLEKVSETKTVLVEWKQGSFLGIGGDRSQSFVLCQYKTSDGGDVPVYINEGWEKPSKLVIDGKVRYGMNNGIIFLVLDDMEHQPYQHRFIQNLMQMGLYAANDLFKNATHGYGDISWVAGDYLRKIE